MTGRILRMMGLSSKLMFLNVTVPVTASRVAWVSQVGQGGQFDLALPHI